MSKTDKSNHHNKSDNCPKNRYLQGTRILPPKIQKGLGITELINNTFLAYNASRLREACELLAREILVDENVTLGLSLTGALTPAGLGLSCIIPLIEHGFVDWIVSTGANLYHDTHFGIGCELFKGSPWFDDTLLRQENVIRIYDVVFDYDVLLSTDKFFRTILSQDEFNKSMSTSEMHYTCGKYIARQEELLSLSNSTILATAYKHAVPVYTSSPGDSSIGMNVAALQLMGLGPKIDTSLDVNETAAIVLNSKQNSGKSAVFILGGGSPKNFILQTEPQIQEVLGIDEKGHDYFIQITDARPDTGGLSGATPSEAVSWGKVDPKALPNTVVCYLDSTIALPLITSYVIENCKPRPNKRLYEKRHDMLNKLKQEQNIDMDKIKLKT